jgi:ferredoxin-NADP reductase
MARAALPRRLNWQFARVVDVIEETPRCTSLLLEPPAWPGHRSGQHVDVRLTAEDGYQAQRSYSIASGPQGAELALTIERLDDGKVSPYLADELRPGDELELRGPIGGYFVWEPPSGRPLLLIAGGSALVPFRAMLRHHVASGSDAAARLLYSARSRDAVLYGTSSTPSPRTTALPCARRSPARGPRTGTDIAGASAASCFARCPGRPMNIR